MILVSITIGATADISTLLLRIRAKAVYLPACRQQELLKPFDASFRDSGPSNCVLKKVLRLVASVVFEDPDVGGSEAGQSLQFALLFEEFAQCRELDAVVVIVGGLEHV